MTCGEPLGQFLKGARNEKNKDGLWHFAAYRGRTLYIDLEQESLRAGSPIELPSQWMVRRELQEYALADRIVTLDL